MATRNSDSAPARTRAIPSLWAVSLGKPKQGQPDEDAERLDLSFRAACKAEGLALQLREAGQCQLSGQLLTLSSVILSSLRDPVEEVGSIRRRLESVSDTLPRGADDVADRTITETRLDLANTALYEITQISDLLRHVIVNEGDEQVLEAVSRGMLSRVKQLSVAVTECLADPKDGWRDEAELHLAIEGSAQPAGGRP